jgi:hypothetical protein
MNLPHTARILCVLTITSGFALIPHGSAAGMLHSYDLTSSLNDLVGSIALTGNPGNIGSNGYSFGAGPSGLTLSNGLSNGASYTIEMRFQLNTVASLQTWSDILNFHNADNELYDYCGPSSDHGATSPCVLQLYATGSGGAILSNTFVDMVINRDGGSGAVNAWLNGAQALTNVDDSTNNYAVFNDVNHIIRFFQDENGGGENSAGIVSRINIYDGAYTPNNLPGPPTSGTPEPASMALFGAGAVALLARFKSHRG